MTRSEKHLRDKAYCGDALLAYLLCKMFLLGMDGKKPYCAVENLQRNKTLAKIVRKRPDIFGEHHTDIHHLGTIYEAHLYDIFNERGEAEAMCFIYDSFEFAGRTVAETEYYWHTYNVTFMGKFIVYEEQKIGGEELTKH